MFSSLDDTALRKAAERKLAEAEETKSENQIKRIFEIVELKGKNRYFVVTIRIHFC